MVSRKKSIWNVLKTVTGAHFISHCDYVLPYIFMKFCVVKAKSCREKPLVNRTRVMEGDNVIDNSAAPESNEDTHSKKAKVKGGYTCCVPGCYSKNKRDMTLSFHKINHTEVNGLIV